MSESTVTCVHHWVIETPRGKVSKGICKNCGETRDFYNSQPEYIAILNKKEQVKGPVDV